VAYEKEADFIGKQAALAERAEGGRLRLRAFRVEAKDADVIGDEPIWLDGAVVGWVTSGGHAHASGQSMAMGYVPREHADSDGPWEIELLGERLAARVQHAPIWDANASRMRG
jgi:dimethylglycine dehydrogenase